MELIENFESFKRGFFQAQLDILLKFRFWLQWLEIHIILFNISSIPVGSAITINSDLLKNINLWVKIDPLTNFKS